MNIAAIRISLLASLVSCFVGNLSAEGPDSESPQPPGFHPLLNEGPTLKVGHWAPFQPVRFAETVKIAVEDSEDHRVWFSGNGSQETDTTPPTRPSAAPVKFGRMGIIPIVRVVDPTAMSRSVPQQPVQAAGIGNYLYLAIGGKLEDLPAALIAKERRAEEEGLLRDFTPTRFAVYESEVERLPQRSLGYDTADLVLLLTGDSRFVDRAKNADAIRPLLQWVKDGGRLVVSLHPEAASLVERMIHDFEFPGKPYEPPPIRSTKVKKLVPVESWSGLSNKPFPAPGSPPVSIVKLAPGPRWEAIAQLSDGTPLLATRPFGFGSLTVVAFPLDGPDFLAWSGRGEFLRTLVDQIGPRYRMPEKTKAPVWRDTGRVDDLGAELNIALDNFDVPRVSFALVAFAILGYLLLAGPIDWLVLRRLFGRLEWTWLTYPLIVVAVSGIAYAVYRSTADAAVRIDRVDLVDVHLASGDMRGTSFFAIRSPDLRALSMELAPNEQFLGPGKLVDPVVSWFGRPDDGPAGMGRAGTQSFSQKEYEQSPDLARLLHVPFADRASKTFLATWRTDAKPRLTADLVYHPRHQANKVTGTIVNDYPFDWVDVSLFVFDRVYRIEKGIPAGGKAGIAIAEIDNGILPSDWRDRPDADRPESSLGRYDPLTPLRGILFHERLDPQLDRKNHLFRTLDWSRRLRDDPRLVNVGIESLGVREAILVARTAFTKSVGEPAEAPTILTLTPADAATKDAVIVQNTYLRAIVPMRPKP